MKLDSHCLSFHAKSTLLVMKQPVVDQVLTPNYQFEDGGMILCIKKMAILCCFCIARAVIKAFLLQAVVLHRYDLETYWTGRFEGPTPDLLIRNSGGKLQ